jgi:hypothetical protein
MELNNKKIKKAEIWADIEFIPSTPNREVIKESTKKIVQKESKIKKIVFHLNQIWRLLK